VAAAEMAADVIRPRVKAAPDMKTVVIPRSKTNL
jgi:hypothetical protein